MSSCSETHKTCTSETGWCWAQHCDCGCHCEHDDCGCKPIPCTASHDICEEKNGEVPWSVCLDRDIKDFHLKAWRRIENKPSGVDENGKIKGPFPWTVPW